MIISVINQKGGVAKTTSTFNIASILADKGKKVLQIDIDPQSNLTMANNINVDDEINMYHILTNKASITDNIYNIKEIHQNLFISPSSIELSVAERELMSMMNREYRLRKEIYDNGLDKEFDYILIDCPPSLGLLTLNALTASEQVLIPVSDELSLAGVKQLLDTIDLIKNNTNKDLKVLGTIATMVDNRTLHSKNVRNTLNNNFEVLGNVDNRVVVKDSISNKTPLIYFAKDNVVTKQYIDITNKIIERKEN